ncbi:hypothetical protein [Brevundimonas sp.]|uniref:hypothetical protein n=1 Tax=Brevundimonas sp. TaxID=1871086 RepID=UPI002FDB2609
MFRAVVAAAALVATPAFAQDAPARYQVELSLVRPNLQFSSTSQIIENSPAETSLTVDGVRYEFNVNLLSVQGDGEKDQLLLESRLMRNDTELAAPRLSVMRGRVARFTLVEQDSGAIEITLSPLLP